MPLRLLFAAVLLLCVTASAAAADALPSCGSTAADAVMRPMLRQAVGLRPEVLRLALDAAGCAAEKGLVKRRELLTVIDYSIPSDEPRLFIFNLQTGRMLFRELVAHGKNSGGNLARFFSNSHGSLATSLGLFVTADTYYGGNGYSLRLRGLEPGVNDMAWDRLIVMHGASYVNRAIVRSLGRLGRSWGCPAVRREVAQKMIDTVKGGSPVFAYYPDDDWLGSSRFIARKKPAGGSGAVAVR